MRKSILIAIIIITLMSVFVGGCGAVITGSGNVKSETFDYKDFTKIEAHDGFEVEISRSSSFTISVTTDDNIWEYLEVTKTGDTLRIRLTGNRIYSSVTLEATITMPEIQEIQLSGGSEGEISGFSPTDSFTAKLSGGSRLQGNIETESADFSLSGGSRVQLSGSSDNLMIDCSGGSHIILEDFPVVNADIQISGGGRAEVDISGMLDANLSGGSRILYTGEPKLGDIDLSGGSTINRK